jgi:acylglycerol lipase
MSQANTNIRGWGRSVKQPRDRGNTGPTSQVLADMHSFLQNLPTQKAPFFLMGHSMGGGQTLNYIFHPDSPYNKDKTSRPSFAGVLLYSPLIALDPSTRPSKLLVAAGRIVAKLIPHMQKYTPLEAKLLSRDEAVCREFVADTLCHDTGTFEGLAGMLDRGIWLEGMFEGAGGWVESELPFWFGHGSGDRITAFPATEVFAEALKGKGGDVQFCGYEGAYHKLHAELPETTEKFFADVKTWVLGKVPEAEGVAARREVETRSLL